MAEVVQALRLRIKSGTICDSFDDPSYDNGFSGHDLKVAVLVGGPTRGDQTK